jgi:hypothetical protein
MSSDNQFTALGGAAVGFQTNSATIDRGADIAGNSMGIHGSCVSGIGVFGESTSREGVMGASHDSVGVHGSSTQRSGVFGESAHYRGGVFSANHQAQLQLIPRKPASIYQGPTSAVEDKLIPQLPKDGEAGDLLAADFGFGEPGNCQLWFCVKSSENGNPAQWRQVTFGSVVVPGVT